jgi:hydrogenase maturation protease
MRPGESRLSHEPALLVGLGSLRGDDSVGLCVASQLAEYEPPGVRVRLATSPTQVFDWLGGLQHLIICDACVSSAPVGHLHRWTWPTNQLEHLKFSGSHDMSLPNVLAIADQLGQLPPVVIIWGVAIATDQVALSIAAPARPLTPRNSSSTASVSELHQLLSEEISAAMAGIVATIHSAITPE